MLPATASIAPTANCRLFAPGRNCWTVARATEAAVLVDACDYFANLEQALQRAERSILIIGWDFDGRIRLCPWRPDCQPLGQFLRSLVEAKPDLHIHILVWSLAVVHAASAPLPLLVGEAWQEHPRITVRLDREHPLYASHHQKIVCIDDSLAFVGGIDLTVRRWDTCDHDEEHANRLDPTGEAYKPVHDVQMAVAGPAARALADVARERWRAAGAGAPPRVPSRNDLWPEALQPDFVDISFAVARTMPGLHGAAPVDEIARLTIDMFAAARHSIYMEVQYLTAHVIRHWMERSLQARHGPEIVLLVKRSLSGVMERFVMAGNRDRMARALRQADRHNRLRIYYPVVPGRTGACEVSVHAKVLIIDDTILRVGSANLNNRSLGLDTECDVAVEAHSDETRSAIAAIRARLLAEHLGTSPAAVSQAIDAQGSLIRAIDRLNRGPRGLRPLPERRLTGPLRAMAGTWLLDPPRPLKPFWRLRRKVHQASSPARGHPGAAEEKLGERK